MHRKHFQGLSRQVHTCLLLSLLMIALKIPWLQSKISQLVIKWVKTVYRVRLQNGKGFDFRGTFLSQLTLKIPYMSTVWLWPKYGLTTDSHGLLLKILFHFQSTKPHPCDLSFSLSHSNALSWDAALSSQQAETQQGAPTTQELIPSDFSHTWLATESRQDNTRFTCTFFSPWGISPLFVYMKPCCMGPLHHPQPPKNQSNTLTISLPKNLVKEPQALYSDMESGEESKTRWKLTASLGQYLTH